VPEQPAPAAIAETAALESASAELIHAREHLRVATEAQKQSRAKFSAAFVAWQEGRRMTPLELARSHLRKCGGSKNVAPRKATVAMSEFDRQRMNGGKRAPGYVLVK